MKTVLLIDEDQEVREKLALWLRQDGLAVIEAADGESGLALALAGKPDLILCDQLAQRCNGFQLCRFVRAQVRMLPQPKIVLISGGSYGVDRQGAVDAGANEQLIKPIFQHDIARLLDVFRSRGGTSFTTVTTRPRKSSDGAAAGGGGVIPPGPMTVRFWGVRGSLPTPGAATVHYGGNTSCVEVRADGQLIILDAGSGLRGLGVRLAAEFRDVPLSMTLLLSHTHWDHIQGFPFFDAAYNPKNKLRILGYEGAQAGLLAVLSSQMESPYFPVGLLEMPSHITVEELKESTFYLGPVEVKTIFLNHPGVCVGYRINSSCGSIAYLPDHEPYQRYKYHTAHPEFAGTTEFLAYGQRMDQKMADFVREADVLILDSQYDLNEYQTRVGWGHGCVDDAVALATQGDVKRLFLFHHDPSHDDEKITRMVEWGRTFVATLNESLKVDAAREGLEIVLKPAEAGVP
jgi:phosphoribosyl 1,2-cyclic phosphodiesterase/ActR/RegA family two-component response regulator